MKAETLPPQIPRPTPTRARFDEAALRGWMVEYQSGRLHAFERVYGTVAAPLRRYLTALTRNAADAQDLLQETFLQIHRSRHTYDPAQPLMPWAFAIARHVYLMSRRAARRRPAHGGKFPVDVDLPVPPEVEGLAGRLELRRAILEIGPDRREALLLHHVWGFSFREVGRVLGITESAAKLRSSRAMADLRVMLRGPDDPREVR